MWQLSFGYFVCGITTATIAVHFVRWAVSEEVSAPDAAIAFGILMGINAIGVIFIGYLSDKMQRHYLLAGVYLVRGVAFTMPLLLPGAAAMWAFAVIGGASWLATVPLTTGLTADVYGVRNVGTLGRIDQLRTSDGRRRGSTAIWAGIRPLGQLRHTIRRRCGVPAGSRTGDNDDQGS